MFKRSFMICLLLIFLPLSAKAQSEFSGNGGKDRVYTRAQVLGYTGFSLGINALTIAEIGFVDSLDFEELNLPWWLYATIGSHHLPLYLLDSKKALTYTVPELAFLGIHLATKERPYIGLVPLHYYVDNEFYSAYAIYKETRGNAKPGIYPEDWKTYDRKELLLAPFKMENLSQPYFYITILATTTLTVLSNVGNEDAIWKTGEAYIDNKKVPISQAVPAILTTNLLRFAATAVGEEALYRGVIYEEMKVSWGSTRAKIFDMILFPAIHVPQEIVLGKSSEDIIEQFVFRSIATLLFDHAYDKGGLPLSTALHLWFNVVSVSMDWAATEGVKSSSSSNGSSAIPPLAIGFSIRF